jgi:hypothetical protein
MSDAPAGWHAIDEALVPLYGDREPLHYGTIIKYRLGGPDPLDGISVYRQDHRNNASTPHWHYVSYGFSELYDKESQNPEVSGYGFEVTFRLACEGDEQEPPQWPLSFLQNLARYVFRTGNVFDVGHWFNLNGPIALETDTAIRAAVFTADPQLPPRDTPNGRLAFLQVVGITLDELEAAMLWKPQGLLGLVEQTNPLCITDLWRASLLTRPEMVRAVEEGVRRDGSFTGGIFNDRVEWEQAAGRLEVTLSATVIARFARLLSARLLHGRDFRLWGRERAILFQPAAALAHREQEGLLTIDLPDELVRQITATLLPQRGLYTWPGFDALAIRVAPGTITDRDGRVIEEVG